MQTCAGFLSGINTTHNQRQFMSPHPSPVIFYKELHDFVECEARAQRERSCKDLSLPLDHRIAHGKCVIGLKFSRKTAPQSFRFECDENLSDFREGDYVSLHRGDPFKPVYEFIFAGDGFLSNGREYIDLVFNGTNTDLPFDRVVDYTLDKACIDLSGPMRKAIEELGRTERGRERIIPLMLGTAEDTVDPIEYTEACGLAEKSGFNSSQQEAIAMGVAAQWCSLIQGPPGTGKTRVLAHIVKQRVERGERILLSAGTHRAIHEALKAIQKAMPSFNKIAKVGWPVTDPDLSVRQYDTFSETPFKNDPGAYVIGATPYAIRSQRMVESEFDCLLLDEASQMTLPLAIMAMLSADVFIIIGDPKQLPPVIQSCQPWDSHHFSLFSKIQLPGDLVQLNVTYRLNDSLAHWIGQAFYSGNLEPSEQAKSRRLHLHGEASANWLETVLGPETSFVWIPTKAKSTRHYSMEETDVINQIVTELKRRGFPLEDLGIVTPFRRQARTIRRRLLQNLKLIPEELNSLTVDTVERMQGQERSVILVSTAASDPGFISALEEFLFLPQRLNVAVSRAKVKVIILSSENFISTPSSNPEIEEAILHWKSLFNSCAVVRI